MSYGVRSFQGGQKNAGSEKDGGDLTEVRNLYENEKMTERLFGPVLSFFLDGVLFIYKNGLWSCMPPASAAATEAVIKPAASGRAAPPTRLQLRTTAQSGGSCSLGLHKSQPRHGE